MQTGGLFGEGEIKHCAWKSRTDMGKDNIQNKRENRHNEFVCLIQHSTSIDFQERVLLIHPISAFESVERRTSDGCINSVHLIRNFHGHD